MEIKEIILHSLSMKQVLEYYGINLKYKQFCCPFHGDKTPSARAYENSYNCFACGSHGDLIQFVQYYFNLNFIEAMKKINYDFGLGINFDYKNEEELKKQKDTLEKRKKERVEKEKAYRKKMLDLCKKISNGREMIDIMKNNINPFEWEKDIKQISYLQEELEWLEMEFEQNLRQI